MSIFRIRDRLTEYLSGLRFPRLFAITAVVFLLDLLIPDVIPFADEIILALVTAMLASFKRRPGDGGGKRR
jgi:Family of unknown function (DUF6116)